MGFNSGFKGLNKSCLFGGFPILVVTATLSFVRVVDLEVVKLLFLRPLASDY